MGNVEAGPGGEGEAADEERNSRNAAGPGVSGATTEVEGEVGMVILGGVEFSLAAVRDVWPFVCEHLRPADLAMFAVCSRTTHFLAFEPTIWKGLCERGFPLIYPRLREDPSIVTNEAKGESPFPAASETPISWHELYGRCSTRVLCVYYVWYYDGAAEAVQSALRLHGIHVDVTHKSKSPLDKTADEVSKWLDEVEKAIKDYRVIIYFTNGGMLSENNRRAGDILANYVASGGSVLIAPFATAGASECPEGKWFAENLHPILPCGQVGHAEYAWPNEPVPSRHPIFKNVKEVCGTYKGTGQLGPRATAIAHYRSSSNFLAAEVETENGLVLAINLHPGLRELELGKDAALLLANGCRYLMSRSLQKSSSTRRTE